MPRVDTRADPEAALLLRGARSVLDPQRVEAPAADGRNLNWTRLLELGARHDLTTILYTYLLRAEPECLSQAPGRELASLCRTIAARNLALTQELSSIAGLLDRAGIPSIAWKGPVLGRDLYGDAHLLRPTRDLDVLVPRQHLARASAVLLENGYRRPSTLTPSAERRLMPAGYAWPFRRAGHNHAVELHWALAPRSSAAFDEDAIWGRARRAALPGADVLVLAPEDLLVALCVHGARHQWCRIKWLLDVAALLERHADLDWPMILRTAEAAGARRRLLLGVRLAHEVLDARVPAALLASAGRDRGVGALCAGVHRAAFADERPSLGLVGTGATNAASCDSLRAKAGCWMRYLLVPTEGDYEAVALPPALAFGYYALRPIRLVGKYALRGMLQKAGVRGQGSGIRAVSG